MKHCTPRTISDNRTICFPVILETIVQLLHMSKLLHSSKQHPQTQRGFSMMYYGGAVDLIFEDGGSFSVMQK